VALPTLACVPMVAVVLMLRGEANVLVTVGAGACAYAVGLAAVAAALVPRAARGHPRAVLSALIARAAG
jgi:hypothetical protein